MLKKILSTILLTIMLVSFAEPIFAFSTSGTGKWVAGQYNSGIKTTDSKGIIIRRLTNYTTNEKITVFCTEFGVDSSTGVIETAQHIVPTDSLMKTACKIAYFGWYSRYGEYAVDGGILTEGFKQVKLDYVFTQQMIWEILNQSNATFLDSNIQNQYILFKNQINSEIQNKQIKPSFCDQTITLDVGQTITLTDANNVLADYTSIDKSIEGIRIIHNKGENTINISVSNECILENYTISEEMMKNWGVIKESTKDNDTTVFFSFGEGVQDQLYAMHYNDPVTMSMNLQINLFGKIELNKLDKDGKLIDGAIFEVSGPNKFSKDVIVSNGKIILDNLKKGIYTIKEKTAPKGYLLDTNTYTVEVIANQTSKQTIINEKPRGTFTLIKKNADKTANIAGAKYRIWNNSFDKELTTDKNGEITLTGLELGIYNYKEIQAPYGYLIDSNTYSLELKYKDQNTSVIYSNQERINTEPTGSITITKEDNKTGNIAQGDATLENAIYKVFANEDIYNVARTKKYYSKGDLVATRITNEKGKTEDVCELPLGRYIVKEENAPNGYMIDKKEYEVNLEYKDQNTKIITGSVISTDKVKEMQVHIYKTGIKGNSGLVAGLEGAEFTIKLYADVEKAYKQGFSYEEVWKSGESKRSQEAQNIAPTYEIITSNENGDAYTKEKLPFGKYIVKETKAPKDFICAEDFTFTITYDESEVQDKVKHLVVNNEPLGTYVKLIKKDADTGKIVTLNSSTFEIRTTDGKLITQELGGITYSSFTTNADNIVVPNNSFNTTSDEKGCVTTPLLLAPGSYEIVEIKVPNGYLQQEKYVSFQIENIKDFDKDKNGDYIKEIVIQNEKPTGTLIINKKITTRETDLSEIQFKLLAKEDIIDSADGSIIYKKGQRIGIYNVDKNGYLKIENLPIGAYKVQEIKTLDGFILDNTKYEVNFSQKDNVTKVYTEIKEIVNAPILKTIKIIKADSETKENIKASFKFAIYEDVQCTKLIKEVNSVPENGTVIFEKLGYGTYYIKEIEAPNGYLLSHKIIKIEINSQGIFSDAELLEDDNSICTLTFYNQKIPIIQTGNERNYTLLLSSLLISISGLILLISKKNLAVCIHK